MFCPICKTEYRTGFTRCSDCNAPLVDSLGPAVVPGGSGGKPRPELLWSGADPVFSDLIRSALDAAEIPYHRTTRDFGLIPGLTPPTNAFFVPARDAEAARAILEQAQSGYEAGEAPPPATPLLVPEDSGETAEADAAEKGAAEAADYPPEDFDPAAATVAVWSGRDAATKDMLVASLGENGIGSALNNSTGEMRLSVAPADADRAREIVREIAEASPPE